MRLVGRSCCCCVCEMMKGFVFVTAVGNLSERTRTIYESIVMKLCCVVDTAAAMHSECL